MSELEYERSLLNRMISENYPKRIILIQSEKVDELINKYYRKEERV